MASDKKAHACDVIMPLDRMKPLLLHAKLEPVHAAIGLSNEGEAVVLLDKHLRPRKVAAMLRAKAGKEKVQLNAASVRFGRVEVAVVHDASTARFFVNKETPAAMRPKLLEVLKRVPFAHVEILVDPSLELEPEEDGAGHAGPATVATHQAAPVPDAHPAANTAAHTSAPTAAHPLNQALALLTKRTAALPAASASRASLVKLATEANAALKANDLAGAAAGLARMRAALGPGAEPGAAPAGEAPDPDQAFAQARLRYDAGRKQVAADVGRLMEAMRSAFAAEPDTLGISAAIGKFAALRDLLDDRLADQLQRGCDASSDDDRIAARKAALDLLDEYGSFLGYHPALLAGMDRNPFVPVAVERTLPALLADLAAQLRQVPPGNRHAA